MIDEMIRELIVREGGYVNHPDDKGGPTKYGITLRTLSDWRKRQVAADDVKKLSIDEAINIYRNTYLVKTRIDLLQDEKLMVLVFDTAVHSGPVRAVKLLQNAVGTIEDGVLGQVTLGAILSFKDPKEVRERFLEARKNFLKRIIVKDPSQIVFEKGWMNRLDELSIKYV